MSLLVNDLSLHGQFRDHISFKNAIAQLMRMRQIVQSFGRELHCHRGMFNAQVTPDSTMPQAIQALNQNEQRALRSWLTQNGPFWVDARNHSADDYIESLGRVVTDTAIGEAAWCELNGIERGLVSIVPSDWQKSPLPVAFTSSSGAENTIDVLNFWEPATLEESLKSAPVPIDAWHQILPIAEARYSLLTFSAKSFESLKGHPFVSGAAQRILSILNILNEFKTCFDEKGARTTKGHELYQDFFTGVKADGGRGAVFTDSSDSEKEEFKSEMAFDHPDGSSQKLFCSWHGKVQTPQLRIHFSWPVTAKYPLYVLYVGPKLTKR